MEQQANTTTGSLNASKPLNAKLGDLNSKHSQEFNTADTSLNSLKNKAMEEVESFAGDTFKNVSKKVSEISSRGISFAKKNPVIVAAAVVGIGYVVAKLLTKSKSAASEIASEAKETVNKLTH